MAGLVVFAVDMVVGCWWHRGKKGGWDGRTMCARSKALITMIV
jgi:hypothetical protein